MMDHDILPDEKYAEFGSENTKKTLKRKLSNTQPESTKTKSAKSRILESVGLAELREGNKKKNTSEGWSEACVSILASLRIELRWLFGEEEVQADEELGFVLPADRSGVDDSLTRVRSLFHGLLRLMKLPPPSQNSFPLHQILEILRMCLNKNSSEKLDGVLPGIHEVGLKLARVVGLCVGVEMGVIGGEIVSEVLRELEWLSLDANAALFHHLKPVAYTCLRTYLQILGPGTMLHRYCERIWKLIDKDTSCSAKKWAKANQALLVKVKPGKGKKKRNRQVTVPVEDIKAMEEQAEERRMMGQIFCDCLHFVESLLSALGPILNPGFQSESQRMICRLSLRILAPADTILESSQCRLAVLSVLRFVCLHGNPKPLNVGCNVFTRISTQDKDPNVRHFASECSSLIIPILRPLVPSWDFYSPPDPQKGPGQLQSADSREKHIDDDGVSKEDAEREIPPPLISNNDSSFGKAKESRNIEDKDKKDKGQRERQSSSDKASPNPEPEGFDELTFHYLNPSGIVKEINIGYDSNSSDGEKPAAPPPLQLPAKEKEGNEWVVADDPESFSDIEILETESTPSKLPKIKGLEKGNGSSGSGGGVERNGEKRKENEIDVTEMLTDFVDC